MEYWRIKKNTFTEIVISALLGMIISLISVLYLIGQINTLNNTINDLQNRESVVITQTEIIEKESKIEEESKDEENKEEIINTEKESVQPVKLVEKVNINTSLEDRELLARLLYCEGGGESTECQRAIMSVIVNRLNSGYWGDTFSSVVYAKGQFSPVASGALNNAKPNQTQYDVVDYVLENGITIPSWVMYFRASYHFSWKGYTPYCNIDNTYFGGMQ